MSPQRRIVLAYAVFGCGFVVIEPPIGSTAIGQPTGETLFCGNNVSGDVSVYAVKENGALLEIAGSPFPAGDNPQALALTADGRLLAVVNATIEEIEELRVFSVGSTGALTEAPGSPYAVGDGPLGMEIGGPGDSEFCFVPSASSDSIHVFAIEGTTLIEVAGSPFATANFPVGAEVTPDGQYVYVSHLFGQVSGYSIGATGALTPVPGSPQTVNGDAFELAVSPDGRNLYICTGLSNVVDAYDIAADGSLSLVPGAPFPSGATSAVNLSIKPDGAFVFVVHVVSDSVTSLARGAGGVLSLVPGSEQYIGSDARKAVSNDDYLFVTDESTIDGGVGVLSYAINPDGTLTLIPGSPFAAGGRPQDMVLFTPPSCVDADFDCDGDVDLDDFGSFAVCYNGSSRPPAAMCPPGVDADLDGDGDVDLDDFAIFAASYTGSL